MGDPDGNFEGGEEYKEPVIFWANYFTWGDLGWSVAECPTWDTVYYCEYATHCGAKVLSRPEGVGFNQTYGGSPTVYWYLNDTEAFEMGKDADIFMYSGSNWEALYESHGEMLDQFKSVQNKQVYDTLGQGASAWNEQRYAEYDIVGGELTEPYVAPEIGCVRPQATGVESGEGTEESSSSTTTNDSKTNATYDWDRGEKDEEESTAAAVTGSLSMGVLSFVIAAVMMVV